MYKKKEDFTEFGGAWYKARLVIWWFVQKEMMDYNDIFSLVVKHTRNNILLGLVVYDDLAMEHLDVKSVLLDGNFDEAFYMHQLKGYKVRSKKIQEYCLRRFLYGLKKSPSRSKINLTPSCQSIGTPEVHIVSACTFRSFLVVFFFLSFVVSR